MIVDRAVARRKFDRDVEPIRREPELYERLGIRPLVIDFPMLRVGLVWPRKQVGIGLELLAPDWDYRPPSADWVTVDGEPWPVEQAPDGNGFQASTPYPTTGRPWLCFRGFREYHEWEGHVGDPWWPLREDDSFRLLGRVQHIAEQLRRL
jgi:hypothetical protein